MKISKLFHWLYAILMLLPVFFVGGRTAYTIFNKNAYESYYGDTINEEKYTLITNSDELVSGNTYVFQSSSVNIPLNNISIIYNLDTIKILHTDISFTFNTNDIKGFRVTSYSNVNYIILFDDNNNTLATYNINSYTLNFKFNYLSSSLGSNTDLTLYLGTYISKIEYNKYSFLDNAFTYSMNEINENVLFSWAQTSFVATPMTYITNLFGMPSNSPVLTLLSYWLSISIIWLTFDLIMYVPLLVHRWIDKGIVE